jgi:hypothetical protein
VEAVEAERAGEQAVEHEHAERLVAQLGLTRR